jgi:formylmethanofuran dehydrogenase subunit B
MRTITAVILAPIMKLTGFRFSKDYRRGTSRYHRTVYTLVDTVGANLRAGL